MDNILESIFQEYMNLEQVSSVAIGGSSVADTSDNISDIDVYIFVKSDIPIDIRENIIKKYSSKYEVGGEYFGSGDEFFADKHGQQLDVMYWNTDWFDSVVDNVWIKCFPSNGYSTAFLYTLSNFKIIYDKDNWLQNLKNSIKTEYPKRLQQNIIKRNLMLMKDKPFASYYEQIVKALKRNDIVSVNHRVAAFLASYFDVIFAMNNLLHPGEKRLVQYAKKYCKILPKNFEENINHLLNPQNKDILKVLDDMILEIKIIL